MANPGADRLLKSMPVVVNASDTTTTNATTTAKNVTGTVIDFPPGYVGAGLTYRIKWTGTKTGTNSTWTALLYLGSTAAMTLTSPSGVAGDYVVEFIIRWSSGSAAKIKGYWLCNAVAVVVDYAASTVDCSKGIRMAGKIAVANTSDSVTSEMATVEEWTFGT